MGEDAQGYALMTSSLFLHCLRVLQGNVSVVHEHHKGLRHSEPCLDEATLIQRRESHAHPHGESHSHTSSQRRRKWESALAVAQTSQPGPWGEDTERPFTSVGGTHIPLVI